MKISLEDVITGIYSGFFGREPDPDGFQEKTKFLESGGRVQDIISEFISSAEFQKNNTGLTRYDDLILDIEPSVNRNVIFFGGCFAENLIRNARFLGFKVDHVLYQSFLYNDISLPGDMNYDSILYAPAFRSICAQVSERILGLHDPDLLYQKYSDEDKINSTMNEIVDEIVCSFISISSGLPIILLSAIEPPSSSSGLTSPRKLGGIYRLVRGFNDYLALLCEKHANLFLLDVNDLITAAGNYKYDGYDFCFAHANFTYGYGNAVFESIWRRVQKYISVFEQNNPIKLIITDLDNTLWKGVLAEEPDDIIPSEHIEGWPIGYAEALIECKRRGILLAICSKNDEDITRNNFNKVWHGRLKLDDFCSVKINWKPKSENIRDILQETGLLVDNALFIDDSPLEINEVKYYFPTIRTLTGDPHRWRMELLYSVPCNRTVVTNESILKTELIRAKLERDSGLKTNRQNYLDDLKMELKFFKIETSDDVNFLRIHELLNKTNQFNTTGCRWDLSEFKEFLNYGNVYALRVKDRLADHGIVSVVLYQDDCIKQFVLSCRVFGLQIENAFIYYLINKINLVVSTIDWSNTGKNTTALNFIENFFKLSENDHIYRISVDPELPSHMTIIE